MSLCCWAEAYQVPRGISRGERQLRVRAAACWVGISCRPCMGCVPMPSVQTGQVAGLVFRAQLCHSSGRMVMDVGGDRGPNLSRRGETTPVPVRCQSSTEWDGRQGPGFAARRDKSRRRTVVRQTTFLETGLWLAQALGWQANASDLPPVGPVKIWLGESRPLVLSRETQQI